MIFNMVGGAGGGKDGAATLTVTAPPNTNITVSKDTKSYTKNSGLTGVAVFQGLTTGQWTVSISNEQQTQTRTINITTTYSIVIAFFAATINITYPAGSTCTVTKGSTVFTAPDTSGTWDCVVPSTGTWVVACTDGELTSSQNVSITTDGQTESITLTYFTATINITYPATSTCTVTNSSGATIATDANTATSTKTFVATVHRVGVYTITATATDGSGKSKSQSVEITSDGQSASVTLTYELVLFNNGVVSGYAWDSLNFDSGYGDAKVSNGLIYLYGYTWDNNISLQPGWGEIGISSAIDLSDYSTLKVRLNKTDGAEGTVKIQVGTTALGDNTATKKVTLTAGTTTSLDISSITGNKYISLYAQSDTGTYGNMIKAYFDKVWLE